MHNCTKNNVVFSYYLTCTKLFARFSDLMELENWMKHKLNSLHIVITIYIFSRNRSIY